MSKSESPPVFATGGVLFIAPGYACCGITDHTLLLAREAVADGERVGVVFLRDSEAGLESEIGRTGWFESGELSIVSLSGDLSLAAFERVIDAFDPKHVIVQFMPSAFRVGTWFYVSLWWLAKAITGRRGTLMVHETSRGMTDRRGPVGLVMRMVRRIELLVGFFAWRKAVWFCSNELHRGDLGPWKKKARVLPVFSNIPRETTPWRVASFAEACERLRVRKPPPPNALICVIFAAIPDSWEVELLVPGLRRQARDADRELWIVSVGEVRFEGLGWARVKHAFGDAACLELGRCSSAEISWLLALADFGLCPTPLRLWRKSGACQAMLQHDLTMIFSDISESEDLMLPPTYGHCVGGELKLEAPPKEQTAREIFVRDAWMSITRGDRRNVDQSIHYHG